MVFYKYLITLKGLIINRQKPIVFKLLVTTMLLEVSLYFVDRFKVGIQTGKRITTYNQFPQLEIKRDSIRLTPVEIWNQNSQMHSIWKP